MQAIQGIKSSLVNDDESITIAKKIYLSYSTEIFKDDQDKEFYLKNKIATKFNVPFSCIAISGSSKTGMSFFKDKLFEPGKSDLDIAIINQPLFLKFTEKANEITNGYTDLTPFSIYRGKPTTGQFKWNLTQGYINHFFMPKCSLRNNCLDFFNKLSNEYFELFNQISGCFYASEYFFQFKQVSSIELYKSNPTKYDKISGTI